MGRQSVFFVISAALSISGDDRWAMDISLGTRKSNSVQRKRVEEGRIEIGDDRIVIK